MSTIISASASARSDLRGASGQLPSANTLAPPRSMRRAIQHRWDLSHNFLSGITLDKWLALLWETGFDVDWLYAHRAAFISAASVFNSLAAGVESFVHGRRIAAVNVEHPPLFILGHWRSGTTHLHNLLSLDTEQFAYPNTYQALNPFTFLTTERINSRLFSWLVPKKRPMDNVELSFRVPQEDEFALSLACLHSLVLATSFPRQERLYSRYLTFQGVPRREIDEWQAAFRWFVQKLTYKHGQKTIVLKSPSHTARVKLLLETFPGARFVHIHRNPLTVFQSSIHHLESILWRTTLQRPPLDEVIEQSILARYREMYDAYFSERELIPAGQLHELSFEDLERDAAGEVRKIYERLNLAGFDALAPRLTQYLERLRGYEKNAHPQVEESWREQVASLWRDCFEAWGYPLPT